MNGPSTGSVPARPSISSLHLENAEPDGPSEKSWHGPTATTARRCWRVAAGPAKTANMVFGVEKAKSSEQRWDTLHAAHLDELSQKSAVPRHDKQQSTTSNNWLDK